MGTRPKALIVIAILVATFALAGCGGSSGDGEVPPELVGSYTTMLEESDLPENPPMELVDGGPSWKLTVATSGGPDDGPVLVIDSESEGNLEAPSLRVEGDRLHLDDQECFEDGSYVFYDNEYKWALEGSTLTLTPVVNQCEDEVALTILTSQTWTKQS